MNITDSRIDGGKAFDWGRTSEDYAKYRDIYPEEFYKKLVNIGICTKGQKVLDLGTGTGVLPRNMYKYGAEFIGTDISENQIEYAKILAEKQNMNIRFEVCSAEDTNYPDSSFDIITACTCFFYFDHEKVIPNLARMLKSNGKLVIAYMSWLPYDDKIAGESEKLILKYNPVWSGCGETRHKIDIPKCAEKYFDVEYSDTYDIRIPFTRESWNGRMKACRGIGASLTPEKISEWENEHMKMLKETAPEKFDVLHYCSVAVLRKI